MRRKISETEEQSIKWLYKLGEKPSDIANILGLAYHSVWYRTRAVEKGFLTHGEYNNYRAIEKGFESHIDFLNSQAQEKGV